jgi:hypothetical protein
MVCSCSFFWRVQRPLAVKFRRQMRYFVRICRIVPCRILLQAPPQINMSILRSEAPNVREEGTHRRLCGATVAAGLTTRYQVQLQIGRLWGTESLSLEDSKSARVWTCHLNLINKEVKNMWISAYTLLVVVHKHKDNIYVIIFWIHGISESADFTLASCVGVRVSNIRAAKNKRDERCLGLVHNHQVDFGIVP